MWDDAVEEAPAQGEAPPAEGAPPAAGAEGAPPAEGAAGAAKPEEAEPPPPEKPEGPKRLVCKHWVRPTSSQYNYIYEYRKNYYDDIIAYLDRRNRGLPVDRPVPQTWGERALRTYMSKGHSYISKKTNKDLHLMHHIDVGARFHRIHTKSLISRKYSKLGFTIVSI